MLPKIIVLVVKCVLCHKTKLKSELMEMNSRRMACAQPCKKSYTISIRGHDYMKSYNVDACNQTYTPEDEISYWTN
jgi:hypothetical protein